MARQAINLELRGLYTSPNNLSGVPPGALEIAENVVINTKNLIESRRGQTQYGDPLSIGVDQVNKLFTFNASLIVNYSNKMAYDSDANGTWIDYSGTYLTPAAGYKIRSLEAQKNFYFTTSEGVKKIDALTHNPRQAGVEPALGGTGTTTGSGGFLVDDSAVAYRLVWGYIDANKNLLLGAPSQRLIIANSTGGAKDVSLTFQIPESIDTTYFYQIYRSFGTLTATDQPTDELQLVIQGQPTAAEIAAKQFTVTDSTPYSLMRTTLYTSPSQEGIQNANYPPPFCLDMDVFKNCAFYANTRLKQSLQLALISVDNPSFGYYVSATTDITIGSFTLSSIADTTLIHIGMRAVGIGIPTGAIVLEILSPTTVRISLAATGNATVSVEFQDRITLANVNYWAASSQDATKNQFLLYNSSTPGINIDQSAQNLIALVNTSSSTTQIYGFYLSALGDLPGQMLFQERTIGGDAFIATSSAGGSFVPPLPNQIGFTGNTIANPTVVTTASPHGLTTGDSITIYQSNSIPSINGVQTVTVISPTTFSVPVNVGTAGTAGYFVTTNLIISSDNDANPNRVYVSKPSQVEAVPLLRYFNIGAANFAITRVVALRDGIFFFKNDGIYRISGEDINSFIVTLLDNTVILKANESAVRFNNQVLCFTTQGICAVTDGGVRILSVAIENQLLELASDQFTYFDTASFGVSYESERFYAFFTVTKVTDQFATQAFIYNSLTDSWTQWLMDRTCGIVNQSVNKLFMAETDTGQILIERKSYTNQDYADAQYDVSIVSVDSTSQVTLVSATNVVSGMTLSQTTRKTLITNVNGNVLTVVAINGLTTGAAIVYTPIQNKIQWAPIDIQNPGILKQFSEISLFFKNAAFQTVDVGFSSNISQPFVVVPVLNHSENGWGLQPWGTVPWGDALGGEVVLRTYVPVEKQRASWLRMYLITDEAFTGFSLQGLSMMFNDMSSRIK